MDALEQAVVPFVGKLRDGHHGPPKAQELGKMGSKVVIWDRGDGRKEAEAALSI